MPMILTTDADHDAPSPDFVIGFDPDCDPDAWYAVLNRLTGFTFRFQLADGTDETGELIAVNDHGLVNIYDAGYGHKVGFTLNFPAVITYL